MLGSKGETQGPKLSRDFTPNFSVLVLVTLVILGCVVLLWLHTNFKHAWHCARF
eukprot:m.169679 g.169679  ORF g.169679 m.169679 type:complete len:54 (-) comp17810_c7_seq2:2986-3147(-)